MTQTPKRKTSRRSSVGVLFVLASLFLISGIFRLGDGTGAAIAREIAAFANTDEENVSGQICAPDPGIELLMADLMARSDQVEESERALEDRLQALRVVEESVRQNMAALVAAEDALARTMARSETAAEEDLAQLTAVYENMKPAEAAALFSEMDPEFSAGFLSRMRPDSAAAVMAGLTPEKAYSISVVLAGRNASAPTE